MVLICRVRVPLGGATAFAYGELDSAPVILEGDRDLFRAIGEALGGRTQPLELTSPAVVLASGQEACETLRDWDLLPWAVGGVAVVYALGTAVAWRPRRAA